MKRIVDKGSRARAARSSAMGLLLLLALASNAHGPTPARAQQDDRFPVPAGLESAVEFWKKVYSEWTQDEVAFHDRDDLAIVYRVIHQKKSDDSESYRANEAAQERIVERISQILLDLAARNPDPRTLSGDYEDVYEAFGPGAGPARWRQAADRIRVQRGLKERFLTGLLHAGQYHEYIVKIFREEGVPTELAWLPMVESTYNIEARSSVGAAGIWQFMPATGRIYMRVDGTIDERLDPILAGRAAARLLKHNFQGLGSWPVAITAYNHGYYGMRRAVRELGTNDYMTIRRQYDGPAFGFASKNFYAEFLAALSIAQNPAPYFGTFQPYRTLEFDLVTMPVGMSLPAVAAAVQVDEARLWKLNPALTAAVWRGQRNIPDGFRLRVPPGYGREAPQQLASSAAARGGRLRTVAPEDETDEARAEFYTVQRGDTLKSIAARHGTTVNEIAALNGLKNRNLIRVGQRLRVSR